MQILHQLMVTKHGACLSKLPKTFPPVHYLSRKLACCQTLMAAIKVCHRLIFAIIGQKEMVKFDLVLLGPGQNFPTCPLLLTKIGLLSNLDGGHQGLTTGQFLR